MQEPLGTRVRTGSPRACPDHTQRAAAWGPGVVRVGRSGGWRGLREEQCAQKQGMACRAPRCDRDRGRVHSAGWWMPGCSWSVGGPGPRGALKAVGRERHSVRLPRLLGQGRVRAEARRRLALVRARGETWRQIRRGVTAAPLLHSSPNTVLSERTVICTARGAPSSLREVGSAARLSRCRNRGSRS